ncbi:MAG: THUMP domain-containing protein [Thermodesulfobacteriota bacterium]
MQEWNILATAFWGRGKDALRLLTPHGEFKGSGFKDVLQGYVEDVHLFLDMLELMRQENPDRMTSLSQILALERTFTFNLPDFMDKLKETVLPYVEKVEGKKFYVRVKRRGHKGEMSSLEIEKEISSFIFEKLEEARKRAQVSFSDPDVIIMVETIANRAGVALVTREMREKYPLIKVK